MNTEKHIVAVVTADAADHSEEQEQLKRDRDARIADAISSQAPFLEYRKRLAEEKAVRDRDRRLVLAQRVCSRCLRKWDVDDDDQ